MSVPAFPNFKLLCCFALSVLVFKAALFKLHQWTNNDVSISDEYLATLRGGEIASNCISSFTETKVLYECYHLNSDTGGEPCSTTRCIESTIFAMPACQCTNSTGDPCPPLKWNKEGLKAQMALYYTYPLSGGVYCSSAPTVVREEFEWFYFGTTQCGTDCGDKQALKMACKSNNEPCYSLEKYRIEDRWDITGRLEFCP